MTWRQRLYNATTSSWPLGDMSLDGAIGLILLPAGCVGVLTEAYFRTSLADADTARQSAFGPTTQLLTSTRVRELETNGIVVIPNALTSAQLARARLDVGLIKNEFDGSRNDDDVRQDVIQWVRAAPEDSKASSSSSSNFGIDTKDDKDYSDSDHHANGCGPGLQQVIRLIRGVGNALAESNYCIASNFCVPQDCQLAVYPGDKQAGYTRHVDCCTASVTELGLLEYWRLSDVRGRVVTVILYLNDSNRPVAEGGQLRYWTTSESSNSSHEDEDKTKPNNETSFVDVVPKGGTMIVFDAKRIPHQVLPSSTERTAITCWINGTLQEEKVLAI